MKETLLIALLRAKDSELRTLHCSLMNKLFYRVDLPVSLFFTTSTQYYVLPVVLLVVVPYCIIIIYLSPFFVFPFGLSFWERLKIL